MIGSCKIDHMKLEDEISIKSYFHGPSINLCCWSESNNRKQFIRKRKLPNRQKFNDLVAIQRMQYGTNLKLKEIPI